MMTYVTVNKCKLDKSQDTLNKAISDVLLLKENHFLLVIFEMFSLNFIYKYLDGRSIFN